MKDRTSKAVIYLLRGAEAVLSRLEDKDLGAVEYGTKLGVTYRGNAEDILQSKLLQSLKGQVQLIFTSPPYPLNRKKKYGNLQGQQYIAWLSSFGEVFRDLLAPDGSLVVELGNAWVRGSPVMSTLALEALLALKNRGQFHLCQEIICFNPARLPTPAQWVTVERIRLKDAFTRLWWLSVTERPKADNRRVLKEYSRSMQHLLKSRKYNSGYRPSEHNIGPTSFLTDNKGAIAPNVLQFANTGANDPYLSYCRKHGLQPHPARMPPKLAEFFIRFLTEEGDLVLDPFAGSNTTGATAEQLKRRWISIEPNPEYIQGSIARFPSESICYIATGTTLSPATPSSDSADELQ